MTRTNVTDFNPATGRTTTTLVECHERGSMDFNCNVGGGVACFECGGAATGATAGIPGTWTPSGSQRPANAAEAAADGVVATPATAWTTGQFVQGSISGAAGRMTWTGSQWVGGVAP